MEQQDRYIFVCTNTMPAEHPLGCCHARGSGEIIERFREVLEEKGLSSRVRVNTSGCFARCEHGPNMVVYPDAVWYGGVTVADVEEIVEQHLVKGEPVERIRLSDTGDFI